MQSRLFGRMPDGTAVYAWEIGSGSGLSASFIAYGGRILSIDVPTPAGKRNVNLGLPTLEAWLADPAHLGAVTGRFANRIKGGRFTLDGREFVLPQNNSGNTLHGGPVGFGFRVWDGAADGDALLLRLTSADGDQGFPGTMDVTVRYAIEGDALVLEYTATTDAPTVVNLTNHAYFNLEGAGAGTVKAHTAEIASDTVTEVDETLVPTGKFLPVAGTPLDLRAPQVLGPGMEAFIAPPFGGYDHCYILSHAPVAAARHAAKVTAGGLAMEVLTTEPAIQLYTGNWLGEPFGRHGGFCLETQHFPDSPNHPGFPSTVLRPGQTFKSRTVYAFSHT
jgi:aldose 1-epimerase